MIDYIEAKQTLETSAMTCSAEDYSFALQVVNGINVTKAYVQAYHAKEPDLQIYALNSLVEVNEKLAKKHLKFPNINMLINLLKSEYDKTIDSRASKQYRTMIASGTKGADLSGDEVKGMIATILKTKSKNIDSSSINDLVSLLRLYIDKYTDVNESEYMQKKKRLIHIFPKTNVICLNCNKEFDALKGITFECPHCKKVYTWSEEDQRVYYDQ